MARSRQVGTGSGEDSFHAGHGVGGAAHHLDLAGGGLDPAHLEAVGVGVGFGLDDTGDGEIAQALRTVDHFFDLKTDHAQGLGDGGNRRVGFQVFLEPTEGELHAPSPAVMFGMSRAWKP